MPNEPCFVIYGPNNVEHPGSIVVRRWRSMGDPPELFPDRVPVKIIRRPDADAIEEARGYVPPGFYRINRSAEDDPCLVESWHREPGTQEPPR